MEVHENLKNIINCYRENHMAHAFLLETNDLERCFLEVLEVIKEVNCPKNYEVNCQENCNLCHLIEMMQFSSFFVIEPDGTFIKKNQILALKEKFATKPVFSKFNVYVVKNAEKLNGSSANAMLKFLEEPEENIIGFFITNNKENVMDTIKSRCQIISTFYKKDENISCPYSDDFLEDVFYYLQLLESKSLDSILINKMLIDKGYDRDKLINFFQLLLKVYQSRLSSHTLIYNYDFSFLKIDGQALLNRLNLITAILKDLEYNVNIQLLLDRFVLEMEGL